ncbi:hypothetical protein M2175_002283 [Bradyrhizobium elkanii]|uniref:Uncharacterized protein n=1 Tax=Bradyrhizobium japonicum TaxID=375 RepID=A0A1L3F6R2_BRAJP|nr:MULTISPECIES: hypothetical protein [Bradyrhizobium]APG08967.1 hypothetical protein BKD09_11555 [Bradyrhizobium japonicum]MCS3927252.1 hypothetical protein [Bradyrhizobium elkanii]MCS3967805.1 hypothetical protein [Bradyrhizobium japonicum]
MTGLGAPKVRQPEPPRRLYPLLQGVPFNSGVALTMKLINASPLKWLSNLLLLSALPASSDTCLLGAPRPR